MSKPPTDMFDPKDFLEKVGAGFCMWVQVACGALRSRQVLELRYDGVAL
jgi:hypothetical protein